MSSLQNQELLETVTKLTQERDQLEALVLLLKLTLLSIVSLEIPVENHFVEMTCATAELAAITGPGRRSHPLSKLEPPAWLNLTERGEEGEGEKESAREHMCIHVHVYDMHMHITCVFVCMYVQGDKHKYMCVHECACIHVYL